jgi:ubiquinone/menaquinone biosynthesis C-methylase UbiE
MKKPEFKKTHARVKESGSHGKKPLGVRESGTKIKQVYLPSKSKSSDVPKTSPALRFEKPTYKGKEDRLAGIKTRNETRAYSGYGSHTPRSSSPRAYTSSKSTYSKPVVASSYEAKNQQPSDNTLKPAIYNLKPSSDTSWGGVANWYNTHLEGNDDTYHTKVLFPNLLRILGDIQGKKVLDLACGQGIFARQLRDGGSYVTGIDLGKELIAIAESKNESVIKKGTHKVVYISGSADDLFMLKDATFDVVVCVLALQNIENLQKTIVETSRVLAKGGRFIFVLNHPSFRNPKQTYWGYSEAENKQYRRVDEYMSESHVRIDMTPGSEKDKKFTVSFHRPLQVYIKGLSKQGLAVTRLEEWVSHKESEKGPKQKVENKARKEIPMFMCIEAVKLSNK